MTIKELQKTKITPGLSYVLGLIYPLYKTGKNNKGEAFIKGCINYNSVSEEDLAEHFRFVINFFNENSLENIDVKSNKQDGFSISSKKGFSILIWIENLKESECIKILTEKIQELKSSNDKESKRAFARGCFDGRSSFDTTMHFLSVDTDRVYERQDLIKSIFDDLDIELNLNRRKINYQKNDQIRLKPKSISKYLKEVDLYSKTRKQALEKFIEEEC